MNKPKLRLFNVELSGVCNLQCKSCTYVNNMRKHITDEILQRVFEQVRTVDLNEIPWFSGGEVTAIPKPRFRDLCEQIAKERKDSNAKWISQVHSNGTIMDEERADIMINSGAFEWIAISADGPNRQYYEANRIKHNKKSYLWEDLLVNIETLLKTNSKRKNTIKITFNCLQGPPGTPGPCPDFLNLLKKYPNASEGYKGSKIPHLWLYGRPPGEPNKCGWQNTSLVMLSNGKLTTCCDDLNGVNVFGDIMDMTLIEAMNLPFEAKYHKIGCRTCVYPKRAWTVGKAVNSSREIVEKIYGRK
jgi:hypothetical protein